MVDPNNQTWTYTYDAYGYKTGVTDPLGNRSSATYNSLGWRLTSTTPKGNVAGANASQFTTTYQYNAFGQLTTTTDALGQIFTRRYDANRNLDRFTDGKGNITNYTYDAANQLTLITRPDLSTRKTEYHPDGKVWKEYDGKNNITSYTYNALGRLVTRTDPLGRATSYSYDGAGNRLSTTDAQVQTTSYTYDVANQLKSISYSDGQTPNVTAINYDPNGLRTSMTDGTGTSSWSYDALNRLVTSTNGAGAAVGYGYDLKGQLTSIVYPGNKTVTRGYDNAGRMTQVADWLNHTISFGYDANSNLVTQTLPAATGVVNTYNHNSLDRIMAITYARNGTTFAGFNYTRNSNNYIEEEKAAGVIQPDKIYSYNALNQLSGAGGAALNYDAADNITGKSGLTYTYDAANQLTAINQGGTVAASFTFDQRGNRTAMTPAGGAATGYQYDQANRLVKYGGDKATYSYNGDGLRMKKTVGGASKSFVWDEGNGLPLLLKEDDTSYIYGPGMSPVAQITPTGGIYYYHHDQLGSIRVITDSAGSVAATYTYDEWGNQKVKTGGLTFTPTGKPRAQGSGGVNNPFGFAGQYTDAESGLIYLRARYYDSIFGQFITNDPIVTKTKQPYSYGNNNPVNMIDPDGNFAFLPILAGAVAGAAIGAGGYLLQKLVTPNSKIDPGELITAAIGGGIIGAAAPFVASNVLLGGFGHVATGFGGSISVGAAKAITTGAASFFVGLNTSLINDTLIHGKEPCWTGAVVQGAFGAISSFINVLPKWELVKEAGTNILTDKVKESLGN